jgi:hypothetical protein
MSKQGKLPGWGALIAVVRALVQDGDYERARLVVRDVARGEGVAQGGIMGNGQGENAFFAVVRGFGIGLEEERMGDFMRNDQTEGSLTERMITQEQEQEPGSVPYEQEQGISQSGGASPAMDYFQEPSTMESNRTKAEAGLKREPGSIEEEEDVHGFLTNEPEIEQRRAPRP